MKKAILIILLALCSIGNNAWSCNGFTPAVTSNTYIGNGQYLLTVDICEFVSNSETLNGVIIDEAAVHGIIITVNGANVIGINTPSLYGVSSGLTIFPTQPAPNQVEYGDWGNSAAPVFLAYGDPQECWQIELIVDGPTGSVDIWGSSSESAVQPGLGMVSNGGIWGCGSGLGVPPATCDASWTAPSLCAGATSQIDLDTMSLGSGTYSGPGVNSATGIFNPSGLSGTISISYLVGDAFFNCTVTHDITFETVQSPTLTDTTICGGDSAPFDALVGPPPPPPPPPVSPCTYSISLFDTWGDGWNGGAVTVLVNGVPVAGATNVTLATGSGPVSYDFDVMPGDVITVNYLGGGFQSENYYTVFDGAGGTGTGIFSTPMFSIPPVSQNVANPCTGGAPPPPPSNCSYSVLLEDSFGDGWNGADLDIYINGVLFQGNITVASCAIAPCTLTIPIPVNDGDVILLNYSGGTWDTENTITMFDNDGIFVNSINNPPDGNLGTGITAVCPAVVMDYSWSPAGSLSDPNIPDPIATPGASTVYTVTITSPTSGCSSTTNVAVTVNNCALPIEMHYFIGSCDGDIATLEWQTVTEYNNDRFDIEYSNDGESFEKIGSVDGIGNSINFHDYKYERADQEDFVGYYRLRQFDLNGAIKTSNVIAVECENDDVTAYMANGMIVISSFNTVENVRVLDMAGRTIFNGRSNNIEVSGKVAAVYFLEVETTESTQRLKVVSSGIK